MIAVSVIRSTAIPALIIPKWLGSCCTNLDTR
jgi:hypothetical protein